MTAQRPEVSQRVDIGQAGTCGQPLPHINRNGQDTEHLTPRLPVVLLHSELLRRVQVCHNLRLECCLVCAHRHDSVLE